MHPIFVRLGVFHLFEKKGGKCTQMWYFWVLFKNIIKKNFQTIDRPKYPLEGNNNFTFVFGPIRLNFDCCPIQMK